MGRLSTDEFNQWCAVKNITTATKPVYREHARFCIRECVELNRCLTADPLVSEYICKHSLYFKNGASTYKDSALERYKNIYCTFLEELKEYPNAGAMFKNHYSQLYAVLLERRPVNEIDEVFLDVGLLVKVTIGTIVSYEPITQIASVFLEHKLCENLEYTDKFNNDLAAVSYTL